jgi:hypothetical protein
VREALLLRHRHLHEKKHRKSESGAKSSIPLIRSLAEIGRKRSEPNTMNRKYRSHCDHDNDHIVITMLVVSLFPLNKFMLFCCLMLPHFEAVQSQILEKSGEEHNFNPMTDVF